VVGFSLGGLLAAWIAQEYVLDRAVAVAPLLGIAGVPVGLTGIFAKSLLRLPNTFVWWDPIRRANRTPLHGYPRFPTHALAQSLLIAEQVVARASRDVARSPIVFVTNADESSVNNRAIARLAKMWKAADAPCVELAHITGLGWSHDIIEPLGPWANVEKSYPVLHTLLERTD
jgi:alpha-beta hydrolase superfamily lysophospholipase